MNRNSTKHRGWRVRAGMVLPVLLVALALQTPAEARSRRNKVAEPPRQEQPESRANPFAGVSKDRIIAAAEKRHGAKVIKVEEDSHNGKRVYVLRLLSKEGKVSKVKVDAETGGEL